MKILHITSHLGGGVGSVLMAWMDKVIAANDHDHVVFCLDTANDKARSWANRRGFTLGHEMMELRHCINNTIRDLADIVLVHYWDHPMLAGLFAEPIPDCRLVFWCHKNVPYSPAELSYPDIWVDTSPVQGNGRFIWSTGDISRFLEIQPRKHRGFNIGTVASPKLHPQWFEMCEEIKKVIPNARFTVLGVLPSGIQDKGVGRLEYYDYIGKVDDIAPYLADMDIFSYPLRPDHFGTAEQVLGECMAAGVVPVVMDNPAELKIVFHMENGLIASKPETFIKKVLYLYSNKEDREILSRNARIRAVNRYNIDNMVQQWNTVFDELMAKPKKARRAI